MKYFLVFFYIFQVCAGLGGPTGYPPIYYWVEFNDLESAEKIAEGLVGDEGFKTVYASCEIGEPEYQVVLNWIYDELVRAGHTKENCGFLRGEGGVVYTGSNEEPK